MIKQLARCLAEDQIECLFAFPYRLSSNLSKMRIVWDALFLENPCRLPVVTYFGMFTKPPFKLGSIYILFFFLMKYLDWSSSITRGQRFNQPWVCNETNVKTRRDRAQRASGLVNLWRSEKWCAREGMGCPSPHSLPHVPLHLFI